MTRPASLPLDRIKWRTLADIKQGRVLFYSTKHSAFVVRPDNSPAMALVSMRDIIHKTYKPL